MIVKIDFYNADGELIAHAMAKDLYSPGYGQVYKNGGISVKTKYTFLNGGMKISKTVDDIIDMRDADYCTVKCPEGGYLEFNIKEDTGGI